jgi:hypothetical protein
MMFDSERLRSVAQGYLDAQTLGKDVLSARFDYVYEATPGVILAVLDHVKSLTPDAEIYRWLREYKADHADFSHASLEIFLPVPPRAQGEPPRKFDVCFDAAIRAAMTQGGGV